jgi:GPH family glycoside/pentoside/hexuronide:cation symporter
MALVVAVFLSKFYVDVVLVPAGILAIAIAVGRAFDAVIDPVIGYLSDHTRSRWGRRKPWILVGVLGNAVAYYALLTPAQSLSSSGVAWWYGATFLISFLCVAASHVPRTALSVELTLHTLERQKLYGMAAAFVALGTILGALMPTILKAQGLSDPRAQMERTAQIYVSGYVALNMLFLLFARERKEFVGRGESPFVPGVRRALRNKPFRVMFSSHVITAIPMAIPAVLMPFFVQYVLELEVLKWTGIFLLLYLGSGFVCLPLWMFLARKYGKRAVWLMCSFIGTTGGLAMFLVGPGDIGMMALFELYVGMPSAAWLFIGGAMHADVVDYDELHTGKRREAQFSALWSIIPKFALIPGAAIPLAVLGSVGYVPNQPYQSESVVLALRLLFAVVPALLNGIGLSLMWWYPLSERRHVAIREGVAKHARGEPAVDPISGATIPPPHQRDVDEATSWFLDYFSPRELRALFGSGPSVLTSVVAQALAYGALLIGASIFAVTHVESLDRNPGPLPALAIVVAGLALTGLLFHALRVRPALRIMRERPAPDLVERHLAAIAR